MVDAHGPEEQAPSWYYHLENQLQFPFSAVSVNRRATSPLRAHDEHEMFVTIRWEKEGLAVPLSQLKPVHADEEMTPAVENWHYWVARGYQF